MNAPSPRDTPAPSAEPAATAPEPEAAPASEELAAAPAEPVADAAPRAEASRNFGPEWTGERTADHELDGGKGGDVTFTAPEFAGSITAIGVVSGDSEELLEKWSATPAAVGVSTIEASGVPAGSLVLRLHISS